MNLSMSVEAFYLWWALGRRRSLDELAQRYGLSEWLVRRRAKRERWTERLWQIDHEVALLNHPGETRAAMRARHLEICQLMKAKAADAFTRHTAPRGMRVSMVSLGTRVLVFVDRRGGAR